MGVGTYTNKSQTTELCQGTSMPSSVEHAGSESDPEDTTVETAAAGTSWIRTFTFSFCGHLL